VAVGETAKIGSGLPEMEKLRLTFAIIAVAGFLSTL